MYTARYQFREASHPFQLPFNELQSKTLMLTVYDYDRLSKDDKMGQLSIPLESIDFGTTTDICGSLCKPENDDDVSHNAYLFFLFVGDISVITAIHGHMSAWRNLNSERTRKANRTVPRVGRIFLFICLILNCIGYRWLLFNPLSPCARLRGC